MSVKNSIVHASQKWILANGSWGPPRVHFILEIHNVHLQFRLQKLQQTETAIFVYAFLISLTYNNSAPLRHI